MSDKATEVRQLAPDKRNKPAESAATEDHDTVHCDRCSGPMFRMRAVYWCANCGYKTDCCGH